MLRLGLILLVMLFPLAVKAGEVSLAVASNFLGTAEVLAERFQDETGHQVRISHGSTGQIYSQIEAGAPFDVFLSADADRPARLLADGTARDVRTYAIGKLVLVSRVAVARDGLIEAIAGTTVALADPTVAPYGLAATRAMEGLTLDTATFRPILVSNVGQVATVFVTGNADFAFLSAAQLPQINAPGVLSLEGLYPPVVQDAALLGRADDNEAAQAFWTWLFSQEARALIGEAGYDLAQ